MDDFKYNKAQQSFEENLEEVLDTHAKEREETEKAAEVELSGSQEGGLQSIIDKRTPIDDIQALIDGQKKTSKERMAKISSLAMEEQIRWELRNIAANKEAAIDGFIADASELG